MRRKRAASGSPREHVVMPRGDDDAQMALMARPRHLGSARPCSARAQARRIWLGSGRRHAQVTGMRLPEPLVLAREVLGWRLILRTHPRLILLTPCARHPRTKGEPACETRRPSHATE